MARTAPQVRLLAAVVSAFASSPASAHHGPGPVDLTQEVVLVGTVVELQWKNPHVIFTIETTDADGATLLRTVEADGVSAVRTSGLAADMLAPGAHVEVRAYPHRRGPGGAALGIDVTTADGVVYPLTPIAGRRTARATKPVPADSIAGRWAPTTEAHRAASGAIGAALTEAGRARLADMELAYSGASGCEPMPVPLQMTFHVLHTIDVRPDTVLIAVDFGQEVEDRVIHLGVASLPDDLSPSRTGYSIGRWDGDALVAETAGLTALGQSGRLVERFSLTADRLRLRYEMTLEDPDTFIAPVTVTELWEHRPDLQPAAEACDPETARSLRDEALQLGPLLPAPPR